ncbi:MAG: helix-turn-helix transcriptional regulator [Bdellovibrionota bacterium]
MKITKLRKSKGLTQAQLAELCGTTQQQVAKLENGIVDPKVSTLRRLASSLKCEIADLFWTRKEFINEINTVITSHEIDLNKINLIDLNIICSKERGIPTFHSFWEEVKIDRSNNSLIFK